MAEDRKKKFKLRDLEVDRVDIVNRGANQHSHIVIAKADDEDEREQMLRMILDRDKKRKKKGGRAVGHMSEMVNTQKHAQHDQKSHGNRDGGELDRRVGLGAQFAAGEVRSKGPDGNTYEWRKDVGSRTLYYRPEGKSRWLRAAVNIASPDAALRFIRDDAAMGSGVHEILKHAQHDQSSHGNWASGGGGGAKDSGQLSWSEIIDNERKRDSELGRGDSAAANTTKSGHRPLDVIAREIRRDWGSKVNYAAKPYLDAMRSLNDITDNYMFDSASSVVAYFLSNASSWRGDKAREIKAELRDILKIKKSEVPVSKSIPGPRPQMTSFDLIMKNQQMGYPPQQPGLQPAPQQPDPMAMGGAMPPQQPFMDERQGILEFMRARLAAMPQQPGMPPGMIGAPPQMPGQGPPSPMGAVPQAPPAAPPGLPQPGSIAPQMPAPAPQPGETPPPPQGGPNELDPAGNPRQQEEKPPGFGADKEGGAGGSKMPETSGDLARQLDQARAKPSDETPFKPKDSKVPEDEEEDEDAERPEDEKKKRKNPFA